MRRHVVLVGLPGAGKTSVGRRAAELLGRSFTDTDQTIEAAIGISIARIFESRGEAAFRVLERESVDRALAGPAGVVAPGGGWAAQSGALESVSDRALTVYLVVEPDIAAGRVGPSGDRPLLASGKPGERMRALFDARRRYYERCEATIDTAGNTIEDVAVRVAELARSRMGW